MRHVLGVIPARGGSKRVPRKNIRELGGEPLIAWTLKSAKLSMCLDYCLVSTGDKEIAEISKEHGGEVPFMRPEPLCEDVDSSLVVKHAVEWYEKKTGKPITHVVTLQPTSPFRNHHDIDTCVQMAMRTGADTVVSVKAVSEHPMWMFETDRFGRLRSYMDVRLKGDNLVVQNLPILWFPNGAVYVTRRDVIMNGDIFGDYILGYSMPSDRSVDLETELDFIIAESLLKTYGKNFPVKQLPKNVLNCI